LLVFYLVQQAGQFATFWMILLGLSCLPLASAGSDCHPFPEVKFKVFSDFIQQQFGSHVTLATVLTILFSLTNNPDLLGLHARQQHPKVQGEIAQTASGWMKTLAQALLNKLGDAADTLSQGEEIRSRSMMTSSFAAKLDGFSKLLKLHPYTKQGIFLGKLKTIDESAISPVQIICPATPECETATCHSRALHKLTRERDISYATLIKGSKIYDGVLVLSGQCSQCLTIYHADHEHSSNSNGHGIKLYLNSAKYLKAGNRIWVDRVFAGSVINGIYSFHASTSAFAEFWNTTFWADQNVKSRKVSRRQIWHIFVQESVRRIAQVSGINLELSDTLPIDKVTEQAFEILGEKGLIRCADGHTCDECTHPYKSSADVVDDDIADPAALVGVDEHCNVPEFKGKKDDGSLNEEESGDSDGNAMVVDRPSGPSIEKVNASVQMIVMDGIVMGPKHCAFEDCTANLANNQNGVYCAVHEQELGHLCHVINCQNVKTPQGLACIQHQAQWQSHVIRFGRSNLLGVQRLLRRNEHERLPWVPEYTHTHIPHDQPEPQQARQQLKHHFVAPRFYCVETICAPCGVVIAWTKFAKAESPTNILDFLESVFPEESAHPNYICIDKACLLLRHAVASGRWNLWKDTTCFVVDSYHYINHRTTDYLCRKYCNPAPLNGSAPNLITVAYDKYGHPHYKRAFNTQACEQLNAWLGGFETILKRMSTGNFNWLLHTMLFIHTQKVIQKQKKKSDNMDSEDDESEEEETI